MSDKKTREFAKGEVVKFYNSIGKIKLGNYKGKAEKDGYIILSNCDSFGEEKIVAISSLVDLDRSN